MPGLGVITRIELSIDELVVHGAAPAEGDHIAGALARELTRLLSAPTPGRFATGGDVARLDAGAVSLAPGADAAALGGQVARVLFGALP